MEVKFEKTWDLTLQFVDKENNKTKTQYSILLRRLPVDKLRVFTNGTEIECHLHKSYKNPLDVQTSCCQWFDLGHHFEIWLDLMSLTVCGTASAKAYLFVDGRSYESSGISFRRFWIEKIVIPSFLLGMLLISVSILSLYFIYRTRKHVDLSLKIIAAIPLVGVVFIIQAIVVFVKLGRRKLKVWDETAPDTVGFVDLEERKN